MSTLWFPLGFILTVLLSQCTGSGFLSFQHPDELPRLMVQRLDWMDEVARVKQASSLPVTDAKREAALLTVMEQEGAQANIPLKAVRSFFSGQMEAAKQYQVEWLAKHPQATQTKAQLPDLNTTVRPALDDIGKRMLTALAQARQSNSPSPIITSAQLRLTQAGYSQAVIKHALKGLETGLR